MYDGTLKFDTSIDKSGFQLGISNLGNIAKQGMAVISAATAAAVAGIGMIGKQAVDTGMDFDRGMSQIGATLGYSIEALNNPASEAFQNMEKLTAKSEEMGAKTAFSASQAADGLNILAQSGYDADESIQMINSVLDMAAAGNLALGQAASYVAGSMKGFTKEAGNFADNAEASAYYADMIAKGATLANTNVQQLGEALSQTAATADTYGQSSEAAEVALLRLAEQNEVGSNAATMLAAAMKNLYAPTAQAKAILDSIGVSAFDEATGKAKDFNQVVDELDAALNAVYAGDENSGARIAAAQEIFGIQGFEAYNKMIASSGKTVQKFYDGVASSAGSAALQAKTMLDNLAGDITIFSSAFDGFKIAVFDNLDTPLRDAVQQATDYMSDLTEILKSDGLDGFASALGDKIADALDFVSGYVPKIAGIGSKIISGFVKGIAKSLPSVVKTLLNLRKTVTDALLNLAKDFSASGKNLLSEWLSGLTEQLPELENAAPELIEKFLLKISENAARLKDSGQGLMQEISASVQKYAPLLLKTVTVFMTAFAEKISEHLPELAQTGKTVLKTVADGVSENFSLLTEKAQEIPAILSDKITSQNLYDSGTSLVSELIRGISEKIQQITEKGREIGRNFLESVRPFLSDAFQNGKALLKQFSDGIKEKIPVLVRTAKEIMPDILDTLREKISDILEIGRTLSEKLRNAISAHLPEILETGKQILQFLLDGFSANLGLLAGIGIQLISYLANAVLPLLPQIIDIALQILQAFAEVLLTNIPVLSEAAQSLISGICDFLKEFLPLLIPAAMEIITLLCQSLLAPDNLKLLLQSALQIIAALAQAILENLPLLLDAALQIIAFLCENLLTEENLSLLVDSAILILQAVIQALTDNLSLLVSAAVQLITFLCEKLLTQENMELLLAAAVEILTALIQGIAGHTDELLIAVETIFKALREEFSKEKNLKKMMELGITLLKELIVGLCTIVGHIAGFAERLLEETKKALADKEQDWIQVGKWILEGILSGLLGVDFDFNSYFAEFGDSWLTGLKDIFGIHSPSKLMRDEVGKYLALGIGEGFVRNMPDMRRDVENAVTEIEIPAFRPDFVMNPPELPEIKTNEKLELIPEIAEIPAIPENELKISAPETAIQIQEPEIDAPEIILDTPGLPEIENPELIINVPELPEFDNLEFVLDAPEFTGTETLSVRLSDIPEIELMPPEWRDFPDFPDFPENPPEKTPPGGASAIQNFPEMQVSTPEISFPEMPSVDVPELNITSPELPDFSLPEISPEALQAFRLQSLKMPEFFARQNQASEIINNHYTYSTVYNSQNTQNISQNAPSGDIIIPVSIGGQQIETLVISAIQIENARSGGRTV